jgi:hypothetical protein
MVRLRGTNYLQLAEVRVLVPADGAPDTPTVTPTQTATPTRTRTATATATSTRTPELDVVNVALGRPASQSSTWSDAQCGNAVAARAVDGNADGRHFTTCSVAITNNQVQPWWRVDLGSVYPIARVEVWNRTDFNSERLANFDVRVSEDGLSWVDYHHPGTVGEVLALPIGRAGRHVMVQLRGTNFLQLAEVRVLVPADGAPGTPTVTPTDTATDTPTETATDTATATPSAGRTAGNVRTLSSLRHRPVIARSRAPDKLRRGRDRGSAPRRNHRERGTSIISDDPAALDTSSLLAGVRTGRYDDPALLVSIIREAHERVQAALAGARPGHERIEAAALATAANERLEQLVPSPARATDDR